MNKAILCAAAGIISLAVSAGSFAINDVSSASDWAAQAKVAADANLPGYLKEGKHKHFDNGDKKDRREKKDGQDKKEKRHEKSDKKDHKQDRKEYRNERNDDGNKEWKQKERRTETMSDTVSRNMRQDTQEPPADLQPVPDTPDPAMAQQ